eukprot:CAMPEP_0177690122 /NCGR_PEP_ID=MMETSP0484_2-20121128/584_1 /TAXON_ID=354590 /ORGANISM="Rhodomonas lens, Strain RHODO" /LENGTH=135 /DNA_ID=CAMNT_0019200617 /DNA_START=294 /DNA_END=701 /DNA_ORIENTATION=+
MTSWENLMRMVVRASLANCTVCAVTRAGKSAESSMPCTAPATKEAQLRWPKSFGTETYVLTSGSFSWIMYSSSFAVLLSSASAAFPNIAFQMLSFMWLSMPTIRVSLFAFSRKQTSSNILAPTPYPAPASFFSSS